ncbi:hypothetical protein [Aeromonas hydrophila]|uniref:hypothetical protein n=1 Tax=Aeromonas hydrophila TaxID=644 RepID=UPI001A1CF885|nr:hypothetical protein [Aeromonas hydrophila]MCP3243066.1 hypothetical protein [Aeromonas hydrophila]MCP3289495.1 hypothetical protein [Aeromonas hydrophila]HAU4896337.1 hypothetical protein [Aeromonas hydrophila]
MTDEQIERLVEQMLRRLQPPLLVMVTAAQGYRQAIRNRLANCGQPLQLALAAEIEDGALWQPLGETVPASLWQQALPPAPYRALVLPFLDYPLAMDLLSGSLQSPVARRLHDALLSGLPVLALRYHCDPASELNQLLGAQPSTPYAGHMQAALSRLGEIGVVLCTMNELLERLAPANDAAPVPVPVPAGTARRYLTVSDVEKDPALAQTAEAQLTDAAIDFLKSRRKEKQPYLK